MDVGWSRWKSPRSCNPIPGMTIHRASFIKPERSIPTMLSDDLVCGRNLTREEALELVDCDLASLLRVAARRRDGAHGSIVSYSRKVFIPLTKLCRDVCHYCTFAQPPRGNERAYLSL